MIKLLLPNIRSAQNVGTIFRTAEAFGVDEILLSGYTPQPIDRFGRERPDIAKAALGAEKMLPWKFVEDVERFLQKEKAQGFYLVGLEQETGSVELGSLKEVQKIKNQKNLILIVGNEVDGIDQDIRNLVDVFVEIPMFGKKESLNVAIATGIMLWEFLGKQDLVGREDKNEQLDH